MSRARIERIDASDEKLVVTGMITSTEFLRQIQDVYRPELMTVPWAREVASWCLDYWKEYGKAPGRHIQDLFNGHARNGLGEENAELIGDFLATISDEHERADHFNVDYVLKKAEEKFQAVRLDNIADDIKTYLSQGKLAEASALMSAYKPVELPKSAGVNPLTNRTAIFGAITREEKDVLFNVPGDLGRFVGPVQRQHLIGIMGPEKRGKTWWLMQFALWGIKEQCNVAFFEVGDMTQDDMIRRIHTNISRKSTRFSGEVEVPVLDCEHNQMNACPLSALRNNKSTGVSKEIKNGHVTVRMDLAEAPADYRPCTACLKENQKEFRPAPWKRVEHVEKLDWKEAYEKGKEFAGRSGGKRFMLSTHSCRSINVRGIRTQLEVWEKTVQFVPDVIVIDYADILAPEDARLEFRHQQNETWQALRALSQDKNCVVITATQANSGSYSKDQLEESNFSEDKRKYGHATEFLTLNQTADEKREGIIRIGRMFVRNDDFDVRRTCTVLQCLSLGRPYLTSYMTRWR